MRVHTQMWHTRTQEPKKQSHSRIRSHKKVYEHEMHHAWPYKSRMRGKCTTKKPHNDKNNSKTWCVLIVYIYATECATIVAYVSVKKI